ncbi:uncharacterized protein LOC129728527 [Wyeomyia smithii]|uniref:uncharacterized protein LOC129728527 n=1 Tax=Wyeomyia smithii TaxID=174621 RepID=UPI002468206F|nr:uncharacterized protein LOC129728527 [Wyeomyia smithii]
MKRAALRRHSKYRTDSTRTSYMLANAEFKQLNDRLYNAYQYHLQDNLNSVFTNELLDPQDVAAATRNVPRLMASDSQIVITDDMVKAAGMDLKCSTGCGPDETPSLVIKRCIHSLATPLTTVFNRSLRTGVFPTCWKDSYVFPVFKKGCKRVVSNYRGIAALSATSKLFELRVLHLLTQRYVQYISPDQHGFISKRSTTTNLTCFTSFVIRQLENGQQVDAIYTNLSAAFDKMNHQIAIAKFDKLGMNVNLLLYYTIKQPKDALFLQQQLEAFADWCQLNRMSLDVSKCSVISFSRRSSNINFNYALAGVQLKRESTVKDLGILLDTKLNFKDHVAYIVSKASSQLGFLFRFAKKFKNIYCLETLYCAIVRPLLECASVLFEHQHTPPQPPIAPVPENPSCKD